MGQEIAKAESKELAVSAISGASLKQYWITTKPKTAIEALNAKGHSIALIRKETPEIVSTAFITYIVTDLIESFNVGKSMNDMQAVFVVNAIISDYYFLKVDELKFIFDKAKKGGYGTMYDRIDAAVIFGWIEQYIGERISLIVEQNIAQNAELNKGTLHPSVAAALKPFFDQKEQEKKEIDKTIAAPKPRERTPQEIIIQDIFKEFDDLHRQIEDGHTQSIRMISYTYLKGKKKVTENLTQAKFLEIRLEEVLKK